jgi:hypothetical protein
MLATRRRFGVLATFLCLVLLISAALIGSALYGASESGRYLILGGMLVLLLSQVLGFALLLACDVGKAIIALVVPGYGLFALRREGHYLLVVGAYCTGALALAMGTILLS